MKVRVRDFDVSSWSLNAFNYFQNNIQLILDFRLVTVCETCYLAYFVWSHLLSTEFIALPPL